MCTALNGPPLSRYVYNMQAGDINRPRAREHTPLSTDTGEGKIRNLQKLEWRTLVRKEVPVGCAVPQWTPPLSGRKVILVREETSPEDVGGMHAAVGILTARGGMTSHAAVVARGMGKCCVCGCAAVKPDYAAKACTIAGQEFVEGDWITLNGNTGEVIPGQTPLVEAAMTGVAGRCDMRSGWPDGCLMV